MALLESKGGLKFSNYVGSYYESGIRSYIKKPGQVIKTVKVPGEFKNFYMRIVRRLYPRQAHYPYHLQELIDAILQKEGSRVITAVPRRHAKTTTILICFAYICFTERNTKQIFATYNESIASEASQQFEAICRAWLMDNGIDITKVPARAFGTIDRRTIKNNIVYFLSLKGACTGKGGNRNIVIDDPIKGKTEAESKLTRDTVHDNITAGLFSGAEFDSVNKIICGTRWHIDDPQGRFQRRPKWKFVNYPAINAKGEALWPEVRPLEFLLNQREDLGGEHAYAWKALMQGEPPDDSFAIFSSKVRRTSELGAEWKSKVVETAYGIDLAYSHAKSADDSAFFSVHRLGDGNFVIDPDYILEKINTPRLFELVGTRTSTVYWYANAAEIDRAPEIFTTYRIWVNGYRSNGKLGNAQNFARHWNEGRVFVDDKWRAESSEGIQMPLPQIIGFTGLDTDPDDAVDAISAAFDVVSHREGNPNIGMGAIQLSM